MRYEIARSHRKHIGVDSGLPYAVVALCKGITEAEALAKLMSGEWVGLYYVVKPVAEESY